MTSPAGVGFPEPDILARWTPSSTRAGVILHPSPDLAGSLRYVTAKEQAQPMPEDSFSSDFAPLSASPDSSLGGAEGRERLILGDVTNGELSVPTAILKPGQFDKLDVMANEDLPIMMKLEQLRKWQQEMQKQLEAHQLEELLCLQEEQQRHLGIVNDPRRLLGESPESTELSEPEWDEETVHYRPDASSSDVPQAACGVGPELQFSVADRNKQLSKDQEEGTWDSKEDEWRRRRGFPGTAEAKQQRKDSASAERRSREGDQVWNDRPIKPGLVGQKLTFEELLEEQLRLEEERLKSAQQQPSPAPPKRAFLKRGEGLSRFTHNSKASSKKAETRKDQKLELQARVISRSNSAPAFIHKGFSNSSPQLSLQRKTAILNKENQERRVCSSPREIRADRKPAWTKVLGTHQRQNTEQSLKTQPESGKNRKALPGLKNDQNKNKVSLSDQAQRSCAPNKHPHPVTKQVGTMEARGNADSDATKAKCSGSKVEATPLTEKEGGVPQDSFEMSFQEKLRRWECDKQLENMELGEFELLEQAAEELSFSSNSSFITKVLQMDQQKQQHLQTAQGLHQRRLSSTPIKSPPRGEPQKCGSVERDAVLVCKSGSAASEEKKSSVIDRVSAEDDDGGDHGRGDQRKLSDVSSAGGSDFREQDIVLFPSPSNPPYDKRSYQEEESFRDSASEDEEDDSVCSDTGDSTLMEDKGNRQLDVIFDDDDTWNDLEVSAGGKTSDPTEVDPTSRSAANAGKPLIRKVAASKATESDGASETDPPPASQLMTRLFPSLKPKAKNTPTPPPTVVSSQQTVQQAQSQQLRERLVELEIEIERFKKENAALAKLRHDHEKKQEELRRERLDFDQTKAAELDRFEDYKKEENRKLQKERKLFEKHASASRAAPDKKEREEIQSLKEQLNSLQEELKRRESRWTSTHTRLRQQIDSLNKENAALREEIQMLEKLRLSAWKKSSIAAETKDSPRISDSGASSGTKGVTFASPLDCIGNCSSPPAGSTAAGPRGNSKDSSGGIKSSLRRSGGSTSSFSSSSSLTSRKQEGRSSPASRNHNLPQTLEQSEDSSVKTEVEPEQPHSIEAEEPESVQDVITHPDGKTEKILVGGDRLVIFPNGTRKEVSADGLSAKITFFNGDTKQITADQRVIYYYAEAQTTHITYPEGLEVLHFPNNQTEKHFPDGRKEIMFPDQTVKNLFPDGREESVLTDGTIIRVNTDGIKEIHFNTGQKEVHTADFKRREYPDGTVKTVYNDGRQETRYPTGRVRIKDKEGNVIMDKRT